MISIQLLCCCYLNYCKINLQYKRCWNLWYLFLYQSIWKIIFSTGRKYKQILLMSHRLKGGDMFWSHKHMQKAVSKVCFEWKKIFCINYFLFKTVFFTFVCTEATVTYITFEYAHYGKKKIDGVSVPCMKIQKKCLPLIVW